MEGAVPPCRAVPSYFLSANFNGPFQHLIKVTGAGLDGYDGPGWDSFLALKIQRDDEGVGYLVSLITVINGLMCYWLSTRSETFHF